MASSALSSLRDIYTDSEDDELKSSDLLEKSLKDVLNNNDTSVSKVTINDKHIDLLENNKSKVSVLDNIELPPEPIGQCSIELQEKISMLTEKMKLTTNFDMNKVIQEKKAFKNPSMYEKLISYCDIDEFGTNYDPKIYDPFKWSESSNYEALAKAQTAYIDQIRKDKKKVQILSGTKRKGNSRWDQKNTKLQTDIKTKTVPVALSKPKK